MSKKLTVVRAYEGKTHFENDDGDGLVCGNNANYTKDFNTTVKSISEVRGDLCKACERKADIPQVYEPETKPVPESEQLPCGCRFNIENDGGTLRCGRCGEPHPREAFEEAMP